MIDYFVPKPLFAFPLDSLSTPNDFLGTSIKLCSFMAIVDRVSTFNFSFFTFWYCLINPFWQSNVDDASGKGSLSNLGELSSMGFENGFSLYHLLTPLYGLMTSLYHRG